MTTTAQTPKKARRTIGAAALLAAAGIGLTVAGCSSNTASPQTAATAYMPAPQNAAAPAAGPTTLAEGKTWTAGGVDYTVTWAAQPARTDYKTMFPAKPFLDVDVHVNNHGADAVHDPNPLVAADGTNIGMAPWVTPPQTADVLPGNAGDFHQYTPLPQPGAKLQIEINTGMSQAYWTGTM